MTPALVALALFGAHPLVTLTVDDCAELAGADVSRVVEVELGEQLVSADPSLGESLTRVTVQCRERVASLEVVDPITGKSLRREIDLPSLAPKARARLLGLAVAELVAASWVELESNPEPKVPPAGPPPAPELRQQAAAVSAASLPARVRIGGGLDARLSSAGMGFGGQLALSRDAPSGPGWTFAVAGHHHSAASALGLLTVNDFTAMAAGWVSGSLGPATVQLGAGARGGPVWLTGQPTPGTAAQGGTVAGAWAGPVAIGRASLGVSREVALELAVEGGWSLTPVSGRVAGQRALTIEGFWGGVSAGASVGL